ncbi:MAG: tetratricopeptide repeat protein [Elusimicrobiales bacterium]|nr:tetratricopeptide repeat protein [Elusimicrobiales bacterium]
MLRTIKLLLLCAALAAAAAGAALLVKRRAQQAQAQAVTWPRVEAVLLADGYPKALSFVDERLRRHPNDALLYYYRARLRYGSGDGGAALADADRAIALGYAQEISHLLKALVHGRLYGDWRRQADLASKALSFDPTYADAYLARAEALYALGEHKACAGAAAAVTGLEPDSVEGWEFALLCREALGDLPGAEAAGLKVVDLKPNDHEAFWRLGRVYAERSLYRQAIKNFSEAILLSGGRPDYYLDRAAACAAEGDLACAAQDRAAALDSAPDGETSGVPARPAAGAGARSRRAK